MASFWFWLFLIIFSLIIGAVFMTLFYTAGTWLLDKLFFKRGIPTKDRKAMSDWIKNNPEKIDYAESKLNKEEEALDERRTFAEFRQSEKLRSAEITARNNGFEERTELSERPTNTFYRQQLSDSTIKPLERSDRSVKLE